MPRPSKYPFEFRERCVRIARLSERLIAAVARDLGIHHETLRIWVRQDEADDGTRSDPLTRAECEELTALRRKVRDLRHSNEILNAASEFAPASSTSAVRCEGLCRCPSRAPRGRADLSGARGILVAHCDNGSQYTSYEYTERLPGAGIVPAEDAPARRSTRPWRTA